MSENVNLEDIQKQLDELREELEIKDKLLKEARAEAAERRIKLKEYEGIDVDEYKQLKSKLQEEQQQKLEKDGKFEEAKKAIIDSYEAKIKEMNEKLETFQSKYKKAVIDDTLINAAAALNAHNPQQIAILTRDNITLDEDGSVTILSGDGKPLFNGQGEKVGVKEYIEDFLSKNPHLVRGAEPGTGSAGGKHKGAEEQRPMSPAERIAAGLKGK